VGPNVLLTDTNRWPNAARLAIRLAKAGCNVSAVCPRRHPLLKTSVVRKAFPYGGFRPLENLQHAIEASDPQLIVPCDDRGVDHLHELFARARTQGPAGSRVTSLLEYSLGPSQSFPIVSARFDLLKVAREEGVRVPEMGQIGGGRDLEQWQLNHSFPWVLKADGSFGGRGVRIVHTPEQAANCFSEIRRPFGAMRVFKRWLVNRDPFWLRPWWNNQTPAVTAQNFIHGRPANCAVVCWNGEMLAGIGVEVVSSEGTTGPATVVRVVENSDMMLAAKKIASRLGLSGFFGLDFMIEDSTGLAYLIEMNPRSTLLCHLPLGPGRDMIAPLFAKLSGEPLRDTSPITQNDMIAYFPQAWHCKSKFLQSSFQDVPEREPALVQDLLHPWPDRSLLYRASAKLYDFAATITKRRVPAHGAPEH
jgi:hypothetical protein